MATNLVYSLEFARFLEEKIEVFWINRISASVIQVRK